MPIISGKAAFVDNYVAIGSDANPFVRHCETALFYGMDVCSAEARKNIDR